MKKAWINNDINIKSINPEKFINNLKKISSSFNNEEENNIGELIIFLLEQIYGEVQTYNEYKEDNREIIYNSFLEGKRYFSFYYILKGKIGYYLNLLYLF